jgi:hypothetical protein
MEPLARYNHQILTMPVKNNSSQQIIQALTTGNFFVECPECGDEIALKKAGLFH